MACCLLKAGQTALTEASEQLQQPVKRCHIVQWSKDETRLQPASLCHPHVEPFFFFLFFRFRSSCGAAVFVFQPFCFFFTFFLLSFVHTGLPVERVTTSETTKPDLLKRCVRVGSVTHAHTY